MPGTPSPFSKDGAAVSTDAFHESAFQVFYDADDRVEYIELSASDRMTALLDGEEVLVVPAEQVVENLAHRTPFDESDPELGYSYVFLELELAFWRPTLPEDENGDDGRTFATVGVGRPGYFSAS